MPPSTTPKTVPVSPQSEVVLVDPNTGKPAKTAVAAEQSASVKAPPDKIRFDHPDAYGVFVLLPADTFYAQRCIDEFEDDLAYLESQPAYLRELDTEVIFPGALLYIAHPKTERVRDPESKRFVQQLSIHLSEPIDVKQFFGALDPKKRLTQQNLRQAGMNKRALHDALQAACSNDPRGYFWLVRETPDGKLKLHDN